MTSSLPRDCATGFWFNESSPPIHGSNWQAVSPFQSSQKKRTTNKRERGQERVRKCEAVNPSRSQNAQRPIIEMKKQTGLHFFLPAQDPNPTPAPAPPLPMPPPSAMHIYLERSEIDPKGVFALKRTSENSALDARFSVAPPRSRRKQTSPFPYPRFAANCQMHARAVLPEYQEGRPLQLRNPLHAAVPQRQGMRSRLPISRSNL